ncbi:universal stress protein [Cellulomonas wangsupingiae]|uniref:Universal stress protein n=1 Tax=Cellulomonas wangsupingiae TaxID=2968085 RepID=A0ABY5K782_9CELL|nr:universal stress protein [Cellulomonas wangsupingiae]MCC2334723.1 universal stress protein [Cellulomonas wangsupingiae]UUI66319.1 universal stress protein [Cellulomonas wangsupingiae]
MGTHVVVGYDGSAEGVAAVRWAAREAARLDAPLQVVHVWGLSGQLDLPPLGTASAYVRAGAQEVADEGGTVALEAAPGLDVSVVLADGPPAQALVDRAAGATYLVVGRQGAGRLSGILMGSVALGTVQHAGCPVVVVPRTQVEPLSTGRVVVGVDGSSAALGAVVAAARHAVVTGDRLVVVTAWRSPVHGRALASWLREQPDVAPDDLARDAARRAQEPAVALLAEQFPGLEVEPVVEEGPAAHVLAQHAERADLLVVGTRGRGGIAGLVLGSVSQWLVARAACPVLVSRVGVDTGPGERARS